MEESVPTLNVLILIMFGVAFCLIVASLIALNVEGKSDEKRQWAKLRRRYRRSDRQAWYSLEWVRWHANTMLADSQEHERAMRLLDEER